MKCNPERDNFAILPIASRQAHLIHIWVTFDSVTRYNKLLGVTMYFISRISRASLRLQLIIEIILAHLLRLCRHCSRKMKSKIPTLHAAPKAHDKDAVEAFRETSLRRRTNTNVFSSGSRRQKRREEMEGNGRVGREKKIFEIDFVGKVEIARPEKRNAPGKLPFLKERRQQPF